MYPPSGGSQETCDVVGVYACRPQHLAVLSRLDDADVLAVLRGDPILKCHAQGVQFGDPVLPPLEKHIRPLQPQVHHAVHRAPQIVGVHSETPHHPGFQLPFRHESLSALYREVIVRYPLQGGFHIPYELAQRCIPRQCYVGPECGAFIRRGFRQSHGYGEALLLPCGIHKVVGLIDDRHNPCLVSHVHVLEQIGPYVLGEYVDVGRNHNIGVPDQELPGLIGACAQPFAVSVQLLRCGEHLRAVCPYILYLVPHPVEERASPRLVLRALRFAVLAEI